MATSADISSRALVADGAKIGEATVVQSGAVVGPEVILGSQNIIGHNVILQGKVTIGNGNVIGPGASIGGSSRQRLRPDEHSPALGQPKVVLGDNNLVFENVTIHSPVVGVTRIGSWNSIGAHTHVGHDCEIRSYVVLSVTISLGGYVIIGDRVNIGMGANIHPRVAIGAAAMIGLGAAVTRHVRPGATVAGVPAVYLHPNVRGMKRANFSTKIIEELERYLETRVEPTLEPLRGWTLAFNGDKARWERERTPLPW